MKSIEISIKPVDVKSFSNSLTDEEKNLPIPNMDDVFEFNVKTPNDIIRYLYKAHCRFKDEYCNFEVYYESYPVFDETKFYYIAHTPHGMKKVKKESKNGFAFDSKEKALFNLLKRRQRYQVILDTLMVRNDLFIEELKQLVK